MHKQLDDFAKKLASGPDQKELSTSRRDLLGQLTTSVLPEAESRVDIDNVSKALASEMPRRHLFRLVGGAIAGIVVAKVGTKPAHAAFEPFLCKNRVPRPGYVNPNPTNGCGPEGGLLTPVIRDSWGKANFKDPCCDEHDRCYGICMKTKRECDLDLGFCARKVCEEAYPGKSQVAQRQGCIFAANAYGAAVEVGGYIAYRDAQLEACDCCKDNEKICKGKCVDENTLCCDDGWKPCYGQCVIKDSLCCSNNEKVCKGQCVDKNTLCCNDNQKPCNSYCIDKDSYCCPQGQVTCGGTGAYAQSHQLCCPLNSCYWCFCGDGFVTSCQTTGDCDSLCGQR